MTRIPWFVWLLMLFGAATMLSSCYSVKQGAHQAKLLWQREDLELVIAEQSETPERLAKLRVVPEVLKFCRERLGLEPGKSYTSYVRLPPDQPLTWVVQAAEKRELRRKSWWFPVIGEQPYLGFFVKDDALQFAKTLKKQGLDTRVAGVDAFSLLGFLSDPIYSSMIDGRSLVEVVDLVIHETVHRTLYVPDQPTFNESFADFVAKQGTILFFETLGQGLVTAMDEPTDVAVHLSKAQREQQAGLLFKEFLAYAKEHLSKEYERASKDPSLADETRFLAHRKKLFEDLEQEYDAKVRPQVVGTWYEKAFQASSLNNAVILGYALYESRPEPFQSALALAGGDVAKMVVNLRRCLKETNRSVVDAEGDFWQKVSGCS